jgi:hypothetical protein
LEALRDRDVLLSLIEDVAGSTIAAANADEKGKVLKGIIRDHLAGADGREKRGVGCPVGWLSRRRPIPGEAVWPRSGVRRTRQRRWPKTSLRTLKSRHPTCPQAARMVMNPRGRRATIPHLPGMGMTVATAPDPVTLPLAA